MLLECCPTGEPFGMLLFFTGLLISLSVKLSLLLADHALHVVPALVRDAELLSNSSVGQLNNSVIRVLVVPLGFAFAVQKFVYIILTYLS